MTAPKWADKAEARDRLVLRTFAERPDWFALRIEPRLVPLSGCLVWSGSVDGRYGLVALPEEIAGPSITVKVHRVAWLREHGAIPFGMTLDHRCRYTACAKVSHLDVVTQRQNINRSPNVGRNKSGEVLIDPLWSRLVDIRIAGGVA